MIKNIFQKSGALSLVQNPLNRYKVASLNLGVFAA